MKTINLLSAYVDKLELNIKELQAQLEESRQECETLRNGYAPGLALQHEHQDLRTQLQSSLIENAAMRVALERIIRVDFCDSVRCDHSAELVDDVARAALSPNAANPILHAIKAAQSALKIFEDARLIANGCVCKLDSIGNIWSKCDGHRQVDKALAQLSAAMGNGEGK